MGNTSSKSNSICFIQICAYENSKTEYKGRTAVYPFGKITSVNDWFFHDKFTAIFYC